MVDDGDCDGITNEELEKISIIIHPPKWVGREDAAKYLGVSLNRFYELRDQGIIKMPRKVRGQKEKLYNTSDLCNALKHKDFHR